MKQLERFIKRIDALRKDLFDAIDYSLKMDGHHKNYEGRITLCWPPRFEDEYTITLDCYVIGPGRHYYWTGKTPDDALDKAEKDIREWIKEEYEHDYDA